MITDNFDDDDDDEREKGRGKGRDTDGEKRDRGCRSVLARRPVLAHLWHDVAQGVHDTFLEVVEHQPPLTDAAHDAREVIIQQNDR